MGRKSETGGVVPHGDRIQVEFSWRGKRLRPTLDLKPTAANLKHARRIRESVLADINAGTFNLTEYFPDYRFAGAHLTDAGGRTFREWADLWVELSTRNLEDSTLRIYRRHLNAYWVSPFGDDTPKMITHERVLRHLAKLSTASLDEATGKTLKPLSRKTQNNILIPLRGVFSLACKSDKYLQDPTEGIDNLKVQKGNPDPFTPDEVEAILQYLRDRNGDSYADYFEFAFFAGLRPSEQIALLWQDVDLRSASIKIRRARVMARDKERTKTTYEREIELNSRSLAVIERQRSRTQLAGTHVFRNPSTGRPWNDEQEQRKVWVIALRGAGVRYRPPKECRDTSVTFSLMAGADPVWVAKQHGHSVQVMLKDYAKWIPKADRGRNLEALNRALENISSGKSSGKSVENRG